MKRVMRWGGLAMLIAAAAGAGVASAQDAPGGPKPRGHRMGPGGHDRMASYLGLTEDQKAQWKAAHDQLRATMQPLFKQMQDQRQQLRAALDQATPDPAAVGQLMIATRALGQKIHAARQAMQTQLEATLTPEQKTKFDALKATQGMGRGFGFRGHRGPGGFGPAPQTPDDGPDEEQ